MKPHKGIDMSTQNAWLLWAPAASALASAVAAIVAAVNVWIQNRNAWRSRAIDLLLKKEAEFESERMQKKRIAAAKSLLANAGPNQDVCSVLDFMESVAILVESDDLEDELAWQTFYYWFSHYYYAAQPLILEQQKKDPAVWKAIASLRNRMEQLQTKKGGNPLPNALPTSIKNFLNEEASLSN